MITRQGLYSCHIFCLFFPFCKEVGRRVDQIKADNLDELFQILQPYRYYVTALTGQCTFLRSLNWEKNTPCLVGQCRMYQGLHLKTTSEMSTNY